MRRARDTALPAIVASRATAWAKVRQIDVELTKAGLMGEGQLLREHEEALKFASTMLKNELDPSEAAQVDSLVQGVTKASAELWQMRMSGRGRDARVPRAQWTALSQDEHSTPNGGSEAPLQQQAPRNPFTDDTEDEISEIGGNGKLTVTNVQRQLSILADNTRLRRLALNLESDQRFADMRRLQELRDPSVDHSWIRRLDFCDGPVLNEDDYALSLQLRLGANVVSDSYECPECGSLSDPKLSHSTCCAKAERTKGHYAVVRAMFDRCSQVDTSAVLEQRGLVEAEPGARPGDIFTTAAVPNRDAAVDVTIVSQEAAAAGQDCVATAHSKKFSRYRTAVQEWGETGIRLQPMVWSCEGRSHPDVSRVMTFCSAALARRSGCSAKLLLKRWRADIGVALAARRSRMARRCLPLATARSNYVLYGELGDGAGGQQAAEGGVGSYLQGTDEDDEGPPAPEASTQQARIASAGPVVALIAASGPYIAAASTDIRLG